MLFRLLRLSNQSNPNTGVFGRKVASAGAVAAGLVVMTMLLSGCGANGSSTEASSETDTTLNRSTEAQPDSCALFTQEQVAGFVGNAVESGTDTGAGQGCYFKSVGGSAHSLLVNMETGDSPAKFADAKSLVTDQTSDVTPIVGIGDEAFTYAPKSGEVATAESRVGSLRVRIVMTGSGVTTESAKQALIAAVERVPHIVK